MPGLTTVEISRIDGEATGYGTFQSHNQKVVSNRNGIFATHIRSRNEAYTAQQWRLSRSVDGGATFTTLYEATHATNPPVLETDAEGNIYLMRVDFVDGNAYLYRFAAADDYSEPAITTVPRGAAGKYSMFLDREREQLYLFSHNNTFHIVGRDGAVKRSYDLLQHGEDALLQYPLLDMDGDVLHAAWTTQRHGIYLYWDIHHMLSRDGGETWESMDGESLQIPVTADQHGRADGIVLDDEYEVHTWLSSFVARFGKLHFLYMAQHQPARQHYMRYDVQSGERERHIWPQFEGEEISLLNLDGLLATRAEAPDAPLYCVSSHGGRIACLVSYDDGETWRDYAISAEIYRPYAIGGCRAVTADGYVIGTFVNQDGAASNSGDDYEVLFFKIRAGLGTRE